MPKEKIPFLHHDIFTLARSVHDQIKNGGKLPSYTQVLHMLTKAAAGRNYMGWRKDQIRQLKKELNSTLATEQNQNTPSVYGSIPFAASGQDDVEIRYLRFSPQERQSALEIIEEVMKRHGKHILDTLLNIFGTESQFSALFKAMQRRYETLHDYQLNKILGAFEYSGICDFSDKDSVEYYHDKNIVFDETCLRKSESNITRQIELFKREVLNSPDGVANDNIIHYQKLYDVYGYLRTFDRNEQEYSFLIREFHPVNEVYLDPSFSRAVELQIKWLIPDFRDECLSVGINTIALENKITDGHNKLIEFLQEQGFRFLDTGQMIWTKDNS